MGFHNHFTEFTDSNNNLKCTWNKNVNIKLSFIVYGLCFYSFLKSEIILLITINTVVDKMSTQVTSASRRICRSMIDMY